MSHRSSNGKPLRRPRLDRCGCGRLKDVSRKAFDVAMRERKDNGFKRAYHRALEQTHDATSCAAHGAAQDCLDAARDVADHDA